MWSCTWNTWDTKRHSSGEYFDLLKQLYLFKYRDQKPRVVVIADDNAFQFVLKTHEDLFRISQWFLRCGSFFFGLDTGQTLANRVLEKNDHAVTIETALTLQPDAKTVHVIVDRNTSGAVQQERFKKYGTGFPASNSGFTARRGT